jgi:anti-sigma B factor antagonist
MNINASHLDPITVIAIAGSVDALTASDVSRFLGDQVGSGHRQLVVDLSQVDFMSSSGLRAILATLKETRQQNGDLRLAGAQTGVEKILKMSGFVNILKTFPTVDEAVASFK